MSLRPRKCLSDKVIKYFTKNPHSKLLNTSPAHYGSVFQLITYANGNRHFLYVKVRVNSNTAEFGNASEKVESMPVNVYKCGKCNEDYCSLLGFSSHSRRCSTRPDCPDSELYSLLRLRDGTVLTVFEQNSQCRGGGGGWLFPRLRGFWEGIRPFILRLRIFFFKW